MATYYIAHIFESEGGTDPDLLTAGCSPPKIRSKERKQQGWNVCFEAVFTETQSSGGL